jgi:hypothetical protein
MILESAKDGAGEYTLNPDDAAYVLGIEAQDVIDVHEHMVDRGIVDGMTVCNWEGRQHAKSTERVRKHRERTKRDETDETVSSVTKRSIVTETDETSTDRQTDIQTKKEIEAAPPTAAPRPKACRLSDDWNPEPEDFPAEQIARELPKFRDFWKAKSGRDATKLDWQATWRNWLRRSDDFKPARNQAGNGSTAASASPVISDHAAQWRARLQVYKPGGFWSTAWGNRPEIGNKDIPPRVLTDWQAMVGQKGEVA